MRSLGFLIDLDGVIYKAGFLIPGAKEFLERIADFPSLFLTNNSSVTAQDVASKLNAMGVICNPTNVLTSGQATASFLSQEKPNFRYYVVGGKGISAALAEQGVFDEKSPDYVVVGEGEGLNYQTLTTGLNCILHGATLIATNPDANLDGEYYGKLCVLPGGGALVAPFEKASGVTAKVIGKPQPEIYRQAMRRLALPVENLVMVGDRPDTDIDGAKRMGMHAILVYTGRFGSDMQYPKNCLLPDMAVDSLLDDSIERFIRPFLTSLD